MKVLIVEDQQPSIKFIEYRVKIHYPEADIIAVSTTKEIERIFSETNLSLVISDLDFDGDKRFIVLEKCSNHKIPSIVYSAHYNISFVEKAMSFKPRAYVCKLSDTSEFDYALKNYKNLFKHKCSFIKSKLHHNVEVSEPILKPVHEAILLETIKGAQRRVIAKKLGKKINTINSYVKEMVEMNECSLIELIHRYSNWKKVKR